MKIENMIIVVCAFGVFLIILHALDNPIAEKEQEIQHEPVHTVKQSIIGCDIILDTVIVDYKEYFLALCLKPKRIESDM